MKTLCIIPAAGNASRMNGLPKFALPIDANNQTLIGSHISKIEPFVDEVVIATKEEHKGIFGNLSLGSSTTLIYLNSISMSDTVQQVLEIHSADRYVLLMPDTYFFGETPHEDLAKSNNIVDLAVFNIRIEQKGKLGQVKMGNDMQVENIIDKAENCDYPYAWGALGFNNEFIKYIEKKDPHVGYAVSKALLDHVVHARFVNCEYFDCGTPQEYFQLIKKL